MAAVQPSWLQGDVATLTVADVQRQAEAALAMLERSAAQDRAKASAPISYTNSPPPSTKKTVELGGAAAAKAKAAAASKQRASAGASGLDTLLSGTIDKKEATVTTMAKTKSDWEGVKVC